MFYSLLSLILLTALFWALGRYKLVKICPVCAAAVITWVWGAIAIYLHASWANPLLVGILMGATLGAVAEKYGKRMGGLWKIIWVILGFAGVYLLVTRQSFLGLSLIGLLGVITYIVYSQTHSESSAGSKTHKDLFEDCC